VIYWAPLLHFYQPPTQIYWVLKKVCDESYRPLVEMFRNLPYARVTVNISAALTELLDEHGMADVIEGLRDLAASGHLEFTDSAKYHPILPLIPSQEIKRQIVLNHQANHMYFGDAYSPQGFFSPEMCYSRDIVKPILDSGHRWLILSGIACPATWPTDAIYEISSNGNKMAVFFRDDILSNKISFRQLDAASFLDHLRQLRSSRQKDIYVITAMDAETFGHHIKSWEKIFLEEVYEALMPEEPVNHGVKQLQRLVKTQKEIFRTGEIARAPDIEVVTISRLLELFPTGGPVEPRPSSWSTSIDDINAGNPYPLWKSKDNPIHQLLWQHLKIAIELTNKSIKMATDERAKYYANIARGLLDRAMHSDQFWWANSDSRWDVNLVNRGLMQQREVVLNAYKAIKMSNLGEDEKLEYYYRVIASKELRSKIMDHLFLQ
jgi:alpha-amylase/alpha-mannosidase (GH57 family)